MMKHLRAYAHTFKVDKRFFHTLAVDLLTWLVIIGGSKLAFAKLERDVLTLTAGQSAVTFSNYLLSLPSDQLSLFSVELKSFVISFVGALVFTPILTLLIYSYSRKIMWSIVINKEIKRGKYWKWVWTTLVLVVSTIGFFIVFAIVRHIISFIPNNLAFALLHSVILATLITVFLLVALRSYSHLIYNYTISSALRHGFRMIKKKKLIVYGTATLLIVLALQFPLKTYYFIYPTHALVIKTFIFLLFLAWLRLLVVKEIKE
jgi:hypothetical protein